MNTLKAGAASIDISPTDSQFLFGYPHVERFSTGIHDPLLSTALYLCDGRIEVMFIANDIIFVTKALTQRVRRRIQELTGMPAGHIMITATHTHSGPKTVDYASNAHDAAVPPVDPDYLQFFEDRIVDAATEAHRSARPARVGLAVADGTGVGTNRRDPEGPSDPEVPVLLVETASGDETIACMIVYSMHPTVLHQDSKLVSGDFPAMARLYVQKRVLGPSCPVLYHTGPAGNQSLRHVTRSNTFEEAERLGHMLGCAIARVIPDVTYTPSVSLSCQQDFIDLPRRTFPTVEEAEQKLERAVADLEHLRQTGAPRQIVRTAEVDWFGAEETVTLARAARDGWLDAYYQASLPAEIQVIGVGPWSFVGWPGEIFVEHALTIKSHAPNTFVISLANGELQGYIVTEESAREGGYEASNSLFGAQSGLLLIDKTLELLSA
jgi:hypothetical protein